MKVISSQKMSELETQAYQTGSSAEEFMEQAGKGIAQALDEFVQQNHLQKKVLLLCGKGNNGGDAFVAGVYLLKRDYAVEAVQLDHLSECSALCKKNGQRYLTAGGRLLQEWPTEVPDASVILDGLFGTGFHGKIKEPYTALVERANVSRLPILAIDIPSGVNGTTGEIEGAVIKAHETIYLGLPKTGIFLGDAWNFVGSLRRVDFGLPLQLIEGANADLELLTSDQMTLLLPKIVRNRHKYQAGYVVGLAGSPLMPGAAQLSGLAALRGGSGIVRLLYPHDMEPQLANSPYELIKQPYHPNDHDAILQTMLKASATFVGPGLGTNEAVKKLLKSVIPALEKPCVIDADALTLLAEEAFKLPKLAVLTPHTGEMQRLLHLSSPLKRDAETLQICQNYAEDTQVTLVLKGAPTFIFHPGTTPVVNISGDAGMATAGSGDVLTGLIAALLSQGMQVREAAILGVYLHGLAGEAAARSLTSYNMIASDIIAHFHDAFQSVTGNEPLYRS